MEDRRVVDCGQDYVHSPQYVDPSILYSPPDSSLYPPPHLVVDESAGSYTSVLDPALYWNPKPPSLGVPYAYPVVFTDDNLAIQHYVRQPQEAFAVPQARSSSSSKCNFRGTCKLKHGRNYWEAHIWWKEGKESGRQLFLGQYKTEELAARARDCGYLFLCRWKGLDRISKKKHFLNFPQETYEQVLQRLTAEADARQDVTEELPAISKFLREKLSKIFSVP